eukprot:1153850-Rhodomonas_salina.2
MLHALPRALIENECAPPQRPHNLLHDRWHSQLSGLLTDLLILAQPPRPHRLARDWELHFRNHLPLQFGPGWTGSYVSSAQRAPL